jgi:lipid A 3-O-deacylase
MSRFCKILLIALLMQLYNTTLFAKDFYLDSPRNKGTLRFEIDNDAIWDKDSNFTNGWSLQYHTVRYATWEETRAPEFLKWVGNHFPTLADDNSIVRYGHGIGQNMITPGDLTNPKPPEGDLPYAGTLTYTLNWQSFNERMARIFQVTAGILGSESFAEDFQKYVHNDLGLGIDPQGWDTQRETEPVLNLAYAHVWRLVHVGNYTNDWAGQMIMGPAVYLGNLITGVDVALGFRFGWNIQEGFNSFPAPSGYGFFASTLLPKPAIASPHSVELILAGRASGIIYSVLYDGSIITSDNRDVDREDFVFAGMIGLNYHYYNFFSIRLAFNHETNILNEESLPQTQPGKDKTGTDNSFGTLMIDFHF